MLNETSLPKITVASLTKKGRVSRSAFYLHYRGIDDLFGKLVSSCFAGAERFAGPESFSFFPLFRSLFTCFARKQAFLLGASKPENRLGFEKRLKESLEPILAKSLLFYRGSYLAIPIPFATEALASAFFGILMEYVEDGFQKTPAQLASYFALIYEGKGS